MPNFPYGTRYDKSDLIARIAISTIASHETLAEGNSLTLYCATSK